MYTFCAHFYFEWEVMWCQGIWWIRWLRTRRPVFMTCLSVSWLSAAAAVTVFDHTSITAHRDTWPHLVFETSVVCCVPCSSPPLCVLSFFIKQWEAKARFDLLLSRLWKCAAHRLSTYSETTTTNVQVVGIGWHPRLCTQTKADLGAISTATVVTLAKPFSIFSEL